MEVYYVEIKESGKVYVLDQSRYVAYIGSTDDVDLVQNSQLHDDDSETHRFVVAVGEKSYPCRGIRRFDTEADYEEWRKI